VLVFMLRKEVLYINYDIVVRSLEEAIIFHVGMSDKTENIYSTSFFVCFFHKE
jgi:hypothetical protein